MIGIVQTVGCKNVSYVEFPQIIPCKALVKIGVLAAGNQHRLVRDSTRTNIFVTRRANINTIVSEVVEHSPIYKYDWCEENARLVPEA